MRFNLTTRWNAGRHTRGEAMIQEILDLGFDHVELGYDLRMDLVPGVQQMVRDRAVKVESLHNFCPVPVGAPQGHPELFAFTSTDSRVRDGAVQHTSRTIRFAAEVGAKVVIIHAGHVEMGRFTEKLLTLYEQGQRDSPAYNRLKMKMQIVREKKAKRHLDYLYQGLEKLIPVLKEAGIQLALENLPNWEAIPSELEMEALLKQFNSPHLRYWHDIGHAQIRESLGLINQHRWIERLAPFMAGIHIHDVLPPAQDHLMPPLGKMDFGRMARFGTMNLVRVIEPAPNTPGENIVEALQFLRQTWKVQ